MSNEEEVNRVVRFFDNKTLFITGGSGFLGKVLIEKLLRCTKLSKIFVLIRTKKEKTGQERLNDIFNEALFDSLREKNGNDVFSKVEPIFGDISEPDLGISDQDRRRIVEETEIIYHSAATVRFDEPLKKAVFINVRGTNLMLLLAKECKKLMVFSHISTAYCHEEQEVLKEEMYPPPADPYQVIKLCEWLSEDLLQTISKKIRGPHANTYTFTKALAEALVERQMEHLPVIVQRPSAVIPIWKEPLPGWTDNVNGPMGLLIGAGKGVIRTMYGSGNNYADFVPVDTIANGLITSAYIYVTNKEPRVFNLTTTDEIKLTFQEIIDFGKFIITTEIPFGIMLWYPGGSLTTSKIYHYIALVLFQILPALIVDAFLFLFGIKPFLVKVQRRIIHGYTIFEYYTNRKWIFQKTNVIHTRNSLNPIEKLMFPLDLTGFDMKDYFVNCVWGARRYILKEPDESVAKSKIIMNIMWCLDRFCKIAFIIGVLYFIYLKFLY